MHGYCSGNWRNAGQKTAGKWRGMANLGQGPLPVWARREKPPRFSNCIQSLALVSGRGLGARFPAWRRGMENRGQGPLPVWVRREKPSRFSTGIHSLALVPGRCSGRGFRHGGAAWKTGGKVHSRYGRGGRSRPHLLTAFIASPWFPAAVRGRGFRQGGRLHSLRNSRHPALVRLALTEDFAAWLRFPAPQRTIPGYLPPLTRLSSRHSIWQFSAMVLPPRRHGVIWSASISSSA